MCGGALYNNMDYTFQVGSEDGIKKLMVRINIFRNVYYIGQSKFEM